MKAYWVHICRIIIVALSTILLINCGIHFYLGEYPVALILVFATIIALVFGYILIKGYEQLEGTQNKGIE